MTKIEKRVLKFCLSNGATCCEDLVPLFEKYGKENVVQAFIKLKDDGMFESCLLADGGIPYSFQLSFKAKHYSEIRRNDLKSFLATHIFTPLVVAIISAMITAFITTKITLWLSN